MMSLHLYLHHSTLSVVILCIFMCVLCYHYLHSNNWYPLGWRNVFMALAYIICSSSSSQIEPSIELSSWVEEGKFYKVLIFMLKYFVNKIFRFSNCFGAFWGPFTCCKVCAKTIQGSVNLNSVCLIFGSLYCNYKNCVCRLCVHMLKLCRLFMHMCYKLSLHQHCNFELMPFYMAMLP